MSKLSLHISDWLNPEITYDFIEQTRPAVVKVFGDGGLNDTKIREALNRSPATVFVGRMYFPDQTIERDEQTPIDTVFQYDAIADAQNAFAQMRPIIEKTRGLVTVWESYNEIPIDTQAPLTERERQKARNYNAFTVEMARLMHDAGLLYAAYSFSTGNPVHVELWDLLLDGLRASDYLALHEYIAPNEEWTEFNTDMCNRYRAIYARVPDDAKKPIIITECGADYLGQQGFQNRIGVNRYLELLADYDSQLMRDPTVVGATIFCYGINAPQWKTYNIGGELAQRLREYIIHTPTPPMDTPMLIEPLAKPVPTQSTLAPFAEILALAQQATTLLDNGDSAGARALLQGTIIPWFYASAPQHSTDLPNAQAQTAARWFAEEAARHIETGKSDEARQILEKNVIAWLTSPGPRALGILSVDTTGKPARKAKARRAKPSPSLLLAAPNEPNAPPTAQPARGAPKRKPSAKSKRPLDRSK